jgi:hypothetical protein
VVCLSLLCCREVMVWCVPFNLERGVCVCLEVCNHREMVLGVFGLGVVSLLDVPSLVANTSIGGTIIALGPRGAMGHSLHFVIRVVLQGDMWVFHLRVVGWILLTPLLSRLLTLAPVVYIAGGRHGGLLVDRLRLLSTYNQRSKVVLQPHPGVDQRVHHFWGQ